MNLFMLSLILFVCSFQNIFFRRQGDGGYQVPIPLFKIRKDMTKEDFDKLYDNWVKVQFSPNIP